MSHSEESETAMVMPVATSTNSKVENNCRVPPALIVCWGASGSQLSKNDPRNHSPSRPTMIIAAAPPISTGSSTGGRTTRATAR